MACPEIAALMTPMIGSHRLLIAGVGGIFIGI
jgi:hypothetical protein